MIEEIETAEFDVTCHTENCPNGEISIRILAPVENTSVLCGVCAKEITDVSVVVEES